MAGKIKGITIEIGGDTQKLNKALEDVNKKTRDVQSELRQVERLLKLDPKNTDLLAQRQKLLAEAVENSREKLDRLKTAQEQVNEQFRRGEIGEEQYRDFQREVAKAEQELKGFENRLRQTQQTSRNWSAELQKTGQKLKGLGTTMSAAVTAPIVGGFVALTQGTKEFRGDLARLSANAEVAGQDMGILNDAMAKLHAVTGETDSNVEGLSNLLATGFRDEQLSGLLDHLYGAAIKFSDTLKFEGIADGLQETLATGAAIGPFAELLERSGVVLDDFNAGLTEAIASGREEEYILETLAKTGLADTYEAWKKNNEEMVKNEEANFRMQQAFAKLGATLEPILTPLIEGVTQLVNKFNEMEPATQKIILVIAGIAAAIGPAAAGFGFMVDGIGKAISAFKDLQKIITGLPKAFSFLTPPSGIIIAAIMAFAGLAYLIYKNWDGIKAFFINLWNKVKEITTNAISSIKNAISGLVEAGKNIVTGIWEGIKSMGTWLYNKVATFVKENIVGTVKKFLGIASPSKVMAEFGRYVAEGLAQGMEEGTSEVAKKAQQMAQAISNAVQKMTGELSNALNLSNARLELQKELLGDNAEEAEKLALELKKLNSEKDHLIKKIDILTAAYETAKKELGENNEATKQYAYELEMAQIELQKMEASIKKTNSAIDEQKQKAIEAAKAQAKELRSLADEVAKVEKKYREDLAEAAREYQNKVEEVNRKLIEDERKVTEEYRNAVKERAKTLRDFVGLFDAVSDERISGRELLLNLQGQVKAFEDWQKNIGELAARGVDEGLIEELREMGPKAGPQIAALNSLTDEQLTQYVALWKEKNKLARQEAVNQLQDQKAEMQQKLEEIRLAAAEQLEAYRVEWQKKNAEIRKNAEEEMKKIEDKFKDIAEAGTKYGISLVANFTSGMESRFDQLRRTLERMAEMVDSYMPHSPAKRGPLSRIMEWGPALVGSLSEGIKKSMPQLEAAMRSLASVPASALAGGNTVSNYYNTSDNRVINITVQDGEDLLRTLHRLGVRIP